MSWGGLPTPQMQIPLEADPLGDRPPWRQPQLEADPLDADPRGRVTCDACMLGSQPPPPRGQKE